MPLLEVSAVRARYGAIEALKGVSLTVGEGEVVTLIGSNGAGKSTTLRSICRAHPGRRRAGSPSTGRTSPACRPTRSSPGESPCHPRAGAASPG